MSLDFGQSPYCSGPHGNLIDLGELDMIPREREVVTKGDNLILAINLSYC